MAQFTAVLGICRATPSTTRASSVMTLPVSVVIQNDWVSVGSSMRVRLSICVPRAQVLAAASTPSMVDQARKVSAG